MRSFGCVLCGSLVGFLLMACAQQRAQPVPTETPIVEPEDESPAKTARPEVPERVLKVLKYIDEHHKPPKDHEGGREFQNRERLLPKRDAQGKPIRYQEWDVNPKIPGRSRDAERLVTGSDGSAHYTLDHYKTFNKIR